MTYISKIIVMTLIILSISSCESRTNRNFDINISRNLEFIEHKSTLESLDAKDYPLNDPYRLDTGDRVRITVFGHPSLTNRYEVDRQGNIALPLIGHVYARDATTAHLSQLITQRLQKKYLRTPSVSVEMDVYRPFFIYGEVNNGGQFPYVNGMTVQTAIAIAGGFSPRAQKTRFKVTRPGEDRSVVSLEVPIDYRLRPGDTIVVSERFF